ncbi:MAG: iron hydrogenase small subunit, partial [Eubacteriales bacterium]|nr:iron hydrogenase small subunit [Eubacteriales bacterium]
ESRADGLYENDKMLQFHSAQENPYIQEMYDGPLTEKKAHTLLHTDYKNRKRIDGEDIILSEAEGDKKLKLTICFGTSCFLRGAQDLYIKLMDYLRAEGIEADTEFKASFCRERCKKGPVLIINEKVLEHCTFEKAVTEIKKVIK